MNKCSGCGAVLQDTNSLEIGYTNNISQSLCERCFRIKNYNDYKVVNKTNIDYIPILKDINMTSSLVVLVVDLFNIPKELETMGKYFNNDILLVLTKRDLIPLSVYEENLLNYFNNYNLNIVDKIIISSKNNYNYDALYQLINKYKTNETVYVVGFTNAGKSSMINKLIYHYTDHDSNITTSILPSTTLNSIIIPMNDQLTLIDTPGIIESGNISNFIEPDILKHITPSKEIKPVTYQIKSFQTIMIENLLRIDCTDLASITIYGSNSLKLERYYKKTDKLSNLKKHIIKVEADTDIVISGLVFIKVNKASSYIIYTLDGVEVYTRKSLI
jgi:hypothetical protein